MRAGFASVQGTLRYAQRFPQQHAPGHFRQFTHVPGAGEIWLPSIGLGTYLGEPTEAADRRYVEAITAALRGGVNLLDTAINYRHQRSERNLGEALEQLLTSGDLQRDEVIICTKAGYLSFDADVPADPRAYFEREYIQTGLINPGELAGGMHCLAPAYLQDQLERSRRNLRLETIDVFYLHNPETQLAEVEASEFYQRLQRAFAMLEEAVSAGKVRWYGLATWNGFRLPVGERGGMDLSEVVKAARAAGGEHHHLRFLQLPFNLAMPEALLLKNQLVADDALSLMELAWREGMAVIGSASLYQSQLTRGLPHWIGEALNTADDAQTALQFARSAPGLATALVGMGSAEHVAANLRVTTMPRAGEEQWVGLFQRT